MMGNIHSIMELVDCWRGSDEGRVLIFCCTHVDAPTSKGMTITEGSGSTRSIHRNWLLRGTAVWTKGSHE
jgi:hypothetical protein